MEMKHFSEMLAATYKTTYSITPQKPTIRIFATMKTSNHKQIKCWWTTGVLPLNNGSM
jgi:hypothetical protein